MLDDDVVAFVFEGDAKRGEESVCGFAHYHCGEELAAEPCAAACWGVSWEGVRRLIMGGEEFIETDLGRRRLR